MQDPDWLATRLAELAAADPALAGRLLAETEDGKHWRTWRICVELDEALDDLEDEASSLGLHDEWYPARPRTPKFSSCGAKSPCSSAR